jgi:DNA (cytosine-5)-methyltransferase 1
MGMEFDFVDLFAGIGGFHMALSKAGGNCVFASEIDSNAKNVYELSWTKGQSFVSGDVNSSILDSGTNVPKHDILTAGFPCQPFSKSGNQHGINEARGTLFWSIARILDHRKPKMFILENVRNLTGPKHLNDYLKMIEILRDIGYAVSTTPTILSPHNLPAKFGGTPQHRERIFITGVYVGPKRSRDLVDLQPLVDRTDVKSLNIHEWNLDKFLLDLKSNEIPDYAMLNSLEVEAIETWSKFLSIVKANHSTKIPSFPIWTEFFKLRKSIRIPSDTPEWKRNFIEQNSNFYQENEHRLQSWLKEIHNSNLTPSMKKFEWQAGSARSIEETLLQFRPSGLRAKRRNYVPAFVAINQTTILGKERRKLLVSEAAKLQGFGGKIQFGKQSPAVSFKQIGNAVHPGVVSFVLEKLVQQSIDLTGLTFKKRA